jgi:tRNA threonylcarbamoyladenosine biosynthesis protein TsaE
MLEFGKAFASRLSPGSVLGLYGDLGSGKTTFVQGLAQGLGICEPLQSPTFVFLNHYSGTIPLFHFDLYRMKGVQDFLGLGFEEYFSSGGICAIEWSERIASLLPRDTWHITFSYEDFGRKVSFLEALDKGML